MQMAISLDQVEGRLPARPRPHRGGENPALIVAAVEPLPPRELGRVEPLERPGLDARGGVLPRQRRDRGAGCAGSHRRAKRLRCRL